MNRYNKIEVGVSRLSYLQKEIVIAMNIPLTFTDISLWLAFTAIILLVTSEFLISSQEYTRRILIDKTRLRFVGIGCGLAFIVTIILRFI
jgi:hypothetical protein